MPVAGGCRSLVTLDASPGRVVMKSRTRQWILLLFQFFDLMFDQPQDAMLGEIEFFQNTELISPTLGPLHPAKRPLRHSAA